MRISAFHTEIAKLVAQGIPPREIKQKIKISSSRISILKANPLFDSEVQKFKRMEEDKYKKALDVFASEAEDVAKEVVKMAKSSILGTQNAPTKLKAAELVLDKVAQLSDISNKSEGSAELTFEQTLRVTKKINGVDIETNKELAIDGEFDLNEAFQELEEDLAPVSDDEILNVTPKPQIIEELKQAVEKPIGVVTTGDNGGQQKYDVSPALKKLLGAA